jgi:hypothetical protein
MRAVSEPSGRPSVRINSLRRVLTIDLATIAAKTGILYDHARFRQQLGRIPLFWKAFGLKFIKAQVRLEIYGMAPNVNQTG